MTLYELSEQEKTLMSFIDDEEVDEQAFMDTWEALDSEIEDKCDCWVKVMKSLDAEAKAIKEEETRLSSRRKTLENRSAFMKSQLENILVSMDKKKFKTLLFSYNIQKNPPSVALDTDEIPDEYLIEQEPKIDKKQMLSDLKNGKDLDGIAHLVQTESLRIR